MAMKSEIVVEVLKIMLKKFTKTKIIVYQNVNLVLNLLNSYDGSRRRRDRSKRSHHRQSHEPDTKQQRRHRKPLNHQNGEAVRAKVSQRNFFSTLIKSEKHILWGEKKSFLINCWWNLFGNSIPKQFLIVPRSLLITLKMSRAFAFLSTFGIDESF